MYSHSSSCFPSIGSLRSTPGKMAESAEDMTSSVTVPREARDLAPAISGAGVYSGPTLRPRGRQAAARWLGERGRPARGLRRHSQGVRDAAGPGIAELAALLEGADRRRGELFQHGPQAAVLHCYAVAGCCCWLAVHVGCDLRHAHKSSLNQTR